MQFDQDNRDESKHFGEISNQIPPNDSEALESWKPAEDIKVRHTEHIHQLKREIRLCKKELEKHLEKKGKVDLISKRLLSVCICRR